jgi:hypothetical protein
VQLQVRVHPALHLTEQLEDRALAVGHRGVRLLHAEDAPGRTGGDLGTRLRDEPHVVDGAAAADRRQQPRGGLGVPEPVVGDQTADHADLDVVQLVAQPRAPSEQQLVELRRPVIVEGHREDQQVQAQVVADRQRGAVRDLDGADGAPLRGEPALGGEPVGQLPGELVELGHESSSAGLIENQ